MSPSTRICNGTCNDGWRSAEEHAAETGEPNPYYPHYGEPDWCSPCTERLHIALTSLPDLTARLWLEVENATVAASERVSGSRERALHANDHASRLVEAIFDRATQWEDYVRGERALTDRVTAVRQGVAITKAVRFLDPQIGWILGHDDNMAIWFDHDIRALRRRAESACRLVVPKPQARDGVPCSQCDLMTLESDIDPEGRDSGRTRCRSCGRLYSADELAQWIALLAADQRNRFGLQVNTGAAA